MIFINLPWGHVRSHTKFGFDRFSRLTFIGHKQTNKHPPRQAKYITRQVFVGKFRLLVIRFLSSLPKRIISVIIQNYQLISMFIETPCTCCQDQGCTEYQIHSGICQCQRNQQMEGTSYTVRTGKLWTQCRLCQFLTLRDMSSMIYNGSYRCLS